MGQVRLLAQEGSVGGIEFGRFENTTLLVVMLVSVLAIAVAFVLVRQVLAADQGTERMREIAAAIQEGSRAYLNRQFRTLAVFVALLFFLLLLIEAPSNSVRIGRSVAFLVGAVFSAVAGRTGMSLAVRANVRVAAAAERGGLLKAMPIAFRAGGVAGMFVVGLGLLGATAVVLLYKGEAANVLFGFGFGAALLAMFMRVGGGIFTKAADVGADLVGKVERSIPEDDPRNAATIADNVGDNVGDCAGMAADLFESFEVTLVAAIVLGTAAFPDRPIVGLLFPLMVQAIGIVASIVGIWMVRPRSESEGGMTTINRGFFGAAVVSAVLVGVVSIAYVEDWRPLAAVVLGLVLASVIQLMTSYYTATEYKPVREIAQASETGPATTILSGFAIGLESTVYAVLAIVAAIMGCVLIGSGQGLDFQLYMISLAGMGMLTTVGVIVSMDTFGPISDNAQGIAEMSGSVGEAGNEVLTKLDAVGNTTKAITKGMAIATAVLAATSLFGAFRRALLAAGVPPDLVDIRIDHPGVLVGLLIGGSVPFMFSAQAIRAVGRAAGRVVFEVRKQFREHPGIMDYTERPNYAAVVDICTRDSLRELLTPGLLAVVTPITVGFLFQAEALGAYLAGAILTGQLLAVMLSNAGGAWDNAKKYVEDGHHGGKNSEPHKATVIGDTVGDPFKDTAGPALNPLIKVMNLVAVLIVPTVVALGDDTAVRVLIAVAGTAVLGWALWRSSRAGGAELIATQAEKMPPAPSPAAPGRNHQVSGAGAAGAPASQPANVDEVR
ncbi:MAG TPA: sodium-translocating pyrophosphatase [Actinomycetes bacterium]|jgi:K(+)-stimulated pyrophosphate-energized sodium pump|nr:sodium-translocating pyrophosphatase [Actinomycetes bacterium]